MAAYIIGYHLNRPGQDYPNLFEAIKSYGNWWHHLGSTEIVKTDQSAVQIRDHLRQFIDQSDELFVGKLSGHAAWTGIPENGSNWLKNNL